MSIPIGDARFDACITPTDSLGPRGHVWLLAVVCFAAVALAVPFLLVGLWPIALFVLADALVLVAALCGFRRVRERQERVVLAPGHVLVERSDHWGRCTGRHAIPLYGLVIERVEDPDYGLAELRLTRHGKGPVVARDLSPGERDDFCKALVQALRETGARPVVSSCYGLPLLPERAVS